MLCLIVVAQFRIVTVCGRNPGLRRQYIWVAGSHWGWMLFVVVRLTVLADAFDPGDAVLHERRAREIARGFHTKSLWQAQDYIGAGNRGYQLAVGALYAMTGAPQFAVYFLNANLGFLGMLSLLELMARSYDLDRVPYWLLLMTILLPSAFFWTTTHLKEGACVWGICTLLHGLFYYPDGVTRTWQVVWCGLGLCVLVLFPSPYRTGLGHGVGLWRGDSAARIVRGNPLRAGRSSRLADRRLAAAGHHQEFRRGGGRRDSGESSVA